MQRSTERILTTHTGSLPRPGNLTHLYAQRARGEPVDAGEIEKAGLDAVQWIVPKQRDVGIDVGNNGEQQRDSFFLYLKERLSGLGLSNLVASAVAPLVDWHEMARLVERGCSPELALEIVR